MSAQIRHPGSAAARARARTRLPGGVSSPVRAHTAVGGDPLMLVRAAGPLVWDADGTEYIDLVGSWGPALLGHAHPEVVEAVQQAAGRGLSFGASTPGEADLAELIAARVPPAAKVRLVSTGTEATMTAIRLARAVTERDLVVKFAGHYHGHSDGLLAAAGSGVATQGLPGSAGVPAAYAALTIVAAYNDLDAVRAIFDTYPGRIAAVITEAAAANMGVVAPAPGFNTALTDLAHAHGALVIADEVLTGFRVSPAGWWGLEQDWQPDLFTFGKVIGGGLPVAALAGSAAVMDLLVPTGPVYQAGTLSGNPVAVAAGIATLRLATAQVYDHVDAVADQLVQALSASLADAGVPAQLQRAGNLFSIAFGEQQRCGWAAAGPTDYAQMLRSEHWRYPAFFAAMQRAGVSLPPSPFEAWFVSASHGPDAVMRITEALPEAALAAASAQPPQ